MSFFHLATHPAEPRTSIARYAAILLAGIFTLLAVTQLYSYEAFLTIYQSFNLPEGERATYFITALTVVAEVFAIPFLLRMRISPAFRTFSMLLGWLAAALWLKMAIYLTIVNDGYDTIGLLGDVVAVAPGALSIIVTLLLAGLTAYVSWGLWPLRKGKG